MSSKAEDVIQDYYASISDLILHPLDVATHLIQEKVVSRNLASEIMDTSLLSNRVGLLMRAVTAAVKANSDHLRVFIAVLERYPEAAPVAGKMWKDLGKPEGFLAEFIYK